MYGYLSEANRDLPPGIPESVWLPGHRKLGLQSKIVRICSGDMNWDSARVSIRRNFWKFHSRMLLPNLKNKYLV